MKAILISLGAILLQGPVFAQDLPPDILVDMYLLEAMDALEYGDSQAAIMAYTKIESLDVEPPQNFEYFYGKLLVEHGTNLADVLKGDGLLKSYVTLISKDSLNYEPALEVLLKADRDGPVLAQDLPPDILVDMFLLEARSALEGNDSQAAIVAYAKIESLDVQPPPDFAYSYGKLLVEHGGSRADVLKGDGLLKSYVTGISKDSTNYEPTLRLLLRANRVLARPEISVFSDCDGCPDMVVIPAGEFIQGSPSSEPDRYDNEGPQRRVSVRSFALGATEVTFAQWDACVSSGGCGHRPDDRGWGRGSRPVINVSWHDAREYVDWLNGRVEGSPYRLPTESEWEYAARAGTRTAYPWGNGIGSGNANCDDDHCRDPFDVTAPVGSFAPNGFGLFDMHGNVWEWVEDCANGDYSGAPQDGSAWRSGDCERAVLRGGSWDNWSYYLRSANRSWNGRKARYDDFGFRVARTLSD